MSQLNHSFHQGGLTCGFNDFQLAEFIQQKRRGVGKLPKGYAVKKLDDKMMEHGYWEKTSVLAVRVI